MNAKPYQKLILFPRLSPYICLEGCGYAYCDSRTKSHYTHPWPMFSDAFPFLTYTNVKALHQTCHSPFQCDFESLNYDMSSQRSGDHRESPAEQRSSLIVTMLIWATTKPDAKELCALPKLKWMDYSNTEEAQLTDGQLHERYTSLRLGTLFMPFHTKCWWYEIADLGRKLVRTLYFLVANPSGFSSENTVPYAHHFTQYISSLMGTDGCSYPTPLKLMEGEPVRKFSMLS